MYNGGEILVGKRGDECVGSDRRQNASAGTDTVLSNFRSEDAMRFSSRVRHGHLIRS